MPRVIPPGFWRTAACLILARFARNQLTLLVHSNETRGPIIFFVSVGDPPESHSMPRTASYSPYLSRHAVAFPHCASIAEDCAADQFVAPRMPFRKLAMVSNSDVKSPVARGKWDAVSILAHNIVVIAFPPASASENLIMKIRFWLAFDEISCLRCETSSTGILKAWTDPFSASLLVRQLNPLRSVPP